MPIPADSDPLAPAPTPWDVEIKRRMETYLSPAELAVARAMYIGVNAQTGTAYGPVLADLGKFITLTNAGAITVTLPNDTTVAFPLYSRLDFQVRGAGMATFAAEAPATVDGTPSLVTRANKSAVTAIKIAANTWTIVGDLA